MGDLISGDGEQTVIGGRSGRRKTWQREARIVRVKARRRARGARSVGVSCFLTDQATLLGSRFQSANADCAGVDYDDARHPALVALVATVGNLRHVAAIGVIAAGMRLRLSACQDPRDIKRPHDSMASAVEAARKASACQPPTAFTMPLPIKLAAVIAFWMKLDSHCRLAARCCAAQGERTVKMVCQAGNLSSSRLRQKTAEPDLFKLPTLFGVRQAKHPERCRRAFPGPPTPLGHLVRHGGSRQIPKNPGIRENGVETAKMSRFGEARRDCPARPKIGQSESLAG